MANANKDKNFFFFSYTRINKLDELFLIRKNLVKLFLSAGCDIRSNEETSFLVISDKTHDELWFILTNPKSKLENIIFYSLCEIKKNKERQPLIQWKENKGYEADFESLMSTIND
ncbi:hypothetical protein COR50_04865 [Chitinophaga caeni]|uniref:Uncharacterized protein n=1 Tax=Chitinophaga caeni TaxID=2029983 RepID=A0A291QRP2_9BACT|nr:hypothetical protein [Chitinophaga caeni]ATL46563.1 hypothetical protein COR50_04865 [Chitinophaga caeni]